MKDDSSIRAEGAGDAREIHRLVALAFGQDDEARLVDAVRQEEGFDPRLTERALETARELGHRIVLVIGHPSYYPRFGFSPAREKGLEVSWPVPDEAFMVMELAAGALEGIRGEVVFPPAFDAAV